MALRASLLQTTALAYIQQPKKTVYYAKHQAAAAGHNIAVSEEARRRFVLTLSGGAAGAKKIVERHYIAEPKARFLQRQMKGASAEIVAEYDNYDLRSSFSSLYTKSGATISMSERLPAPKDSPGVGDYEIYRKNVVPTPSLSSSALRFESVAEKVAKEMHRAKYQIPYDRNIGPQSYWTGVSRPEGRVRQINSDERFVRNIVLEKKMEPGPGLTPRADLRTLRGGTFSESGHDLDGFLFGV